MGKTGRGWVRAAACSCRTGRPILASLAPLDAGGTALPSRVEISAIELGTAEWQRVEVGRVSARKRGRPDAARKSNA